MIISKLWKDQMWTIPRKILWKKKPFYHEITLNFSGSIQANDENYKIKKVYLTTER